MTAPKDGRQSPEGKCLDILPSIENLYEKRAALREDVDSRDRAAARGARAGIAIIDAMLKAIAALEDVSRTRQAVR